MTAPAPVPTFVSEKPPEITPLSVSPPAAEEPMEAFDPRITLFVVLETVANPLCKAPVLFRPLPFKVIVVPAPGLKAAICTSSVPPLFTRKERFAVFPSALTLVTRTMPPLTVTFPVYPV